MSITAGQILEWLGGQVDVRLEYAVDGSGNSVGKYSDIVDWETEILDPDSNPVDLTGYVMRTNIRRGQERWDSRFSAATARITLDNTTGVFTPDLSTDPPTWSEIRLGTIIRVVILPDPNDPTLIVPRFTGRVESMNDRFSGGGEDIVTDIQAIDPLGDLHDFNPSASSPTGVQATDDRVRAVLDNMGWPVSLRSIQYGQHNMATSELAQPALEESQRAADAEGGQFYADGDGTLVFKNRDWLLDAEELMQYYEDLVLTRDPIALWRMTDAATADTTGNGHTLTWNGSPTTDQDGVTTDDESILLDGSDDYATVASEGDLEIHGDITLEAWIKPDGSNTGDNAIITARGTSGDLGLYEFYWDGTSQRLELWISGWGASVATTLNNTILPDEWTHVVAAIDWDTPAVGDITVKLYINGELARTRSGTGQPAPTDRAVNIGARGGTGLFFAGNISEVVAYDFILTDEEIEANYDAKTTGINTRAREVQGYIGFRDDHLTHVDDDFTGTVIDTDLWEEIEDWTQDDQLLGTTDGNDCNLVSFYHPNGADEWDAWVEVIEPTSFPSGPTSGGFVQTLLIVDNEEVGTRFVQFQVYEDENNTPMRLWVQAAGLGTLLDIPYDPVDHRWLRIKKEDGVVHWMVSADGVTWSTLHTESGIPQYESVAVQLYTDANTTTTQAILDNAFFSVHRWPTAEITDIDTSWEIQRVRNDIQFARSEGALQRVEDTGSQDENGVRTYSRRDFRNNSDTEVLTLADRNLAAYKDARPRVDSVTISANEDPLDLDLNRLFWDSRFGDLLSIRVETLHDWSYDRQVHIIGIEDEITADDWVVTFSLDDSIIAVLEAL